MTIGTSILLVVIFLVRNVHSAEYKIVSLNSSLALPKAYKWNFCGIPESPYHALYPYGIVRMDENTTKWDMSNNGSINENFAIALKISTCHSPVFNPELFLSLLKHKKLTVVGDSLALQQLEALFNGLAPYVSSYSNATHDMLSYVRDTHIFVANMRSYDSTISLCLNPLFDKCPESYADVFILGPGAHFKPKYMNAHRLETVSYNESYHLARKALTNTIADVRNRIKDKMPNSIVIWRLLPHIGRYMEHHLAHPNTIHNGDVKVWSNISMGSAWVPVYNDIIKKQAAVFNDSVMDWYSLSLDYLKYFSEDRGMPVHADSLHYFADGLPRGSNLMLQDVLCDLMLTGKLK